MFGDQVTSQQSCRIETGLNLQRFKEHTVGRIFFAISTIFFFIAAVGATFMPNPVSWGFVFLALGLAVGAWIPWRKGTL